METTSNQQNNGQGFAIASLVIGIFALLFSIIPCVGTSAILIGTVAVIFGAVALTKANNPESPKGLSIAGISLGALAIVIAIFWIVFIVGSKSFFQDKFDNKFENIFEWADEFDNINIDVEEDEFKDMESLDDLEKALDDLEGVIDNVNTELDDTLRDVHKDAKKEIEQAKEKLKNAQEKDKEASE